MRVQRALLGGLLGALLVLSGTGLAVGAPLGSSAAAASAPTNDSAGGAQTIQVPGTVTLAMAGAQATDEDRAFAQSCGQGGVGPTVWVAFTAQDAARIWLNGRPSRTPVVMAAFAGTPQASSQLGCGVDNLWLDVVAGQQYYVMLGTLPAVTYPYLTISAEDVTGIPAPSASVTVDRIAVRDSRSGLTKISGTRTCDAGVAELNVRVSQRTATSTFGVVPSPCVAGVSTWSVTTYGTALRRGDANVTATLAVVSSGGQTVADNTTTVWVRNGRLRA